MSLQTNVAAAFARLVQACNVLAGRVQPAGGTAGQVLTKTAAADYAAAWQTPAGDGGGPAVQTVLLTVPTVAKGYAEVVVADAAVSATSKVMALLVGELDAENDLEELADSAMRVFAVPEAGQVRFVLTGNGPFLGDFKTNYQVAV